MRLIEIYDLSLDEEGEEGEDVEEAILLATYSQPVASVCQTDKHSNREHVLE